MTVTAKKKNEKFSMPHRAAFDPAVHSITALTETFMAQGVPEKTARTMAQDRHARTLRENRERHA